MKKLSPSRKGALGEKQGLAFFQKILQVPDCATDWKLKTPCSIAGYHQDQFKVFDFLINTTNFETLGIQIKTNASSTSPGKRKEWCLDVIKAYFKPTNSYLVLWDIENNKPLKIWGAWQILKTELK